jgi:hypothetical protein
MGTPARENRWYLLATLAGTKSINHANNQCLWNGYQCVVLGDQFSSDDPDMAKLPNLSAADLTRIRAIEHLPPTLGPYIAMRFQGLEFPAVDFDGFYFGVPVTWDNATFCGDARFRGVAAFTQTTFCGPAAFVDTVLDKHADFELATFHQDAWFNDNTGNIKVVALLFLQAIF